MYRMCTTLQPCKRRNLIAIRAAAVGSERIGILTALVESQLFSVLPPHTRYVAGEVDYKVFMYQPSESAEFLKTMYRGSIHMGTGVEASRSFDAITNTHTTASYRSQKIMTQYHTPTEKLSSTEYSTEYFQHHHHKTSHQYPEIPLKFTRT